MQNLNNFQFLFSSFHFSITICSFHSFFRCRKTTIKKIRHKIFCVHLEDFFQQFLRVHTISESRMNYYIKIGPLLL